MLDTYKIIYSDSENIHFDLPSDMSIDNEMIIGGYKAEYNYLSDYLQACGAVNIRQEFVDEYEGITIVRIIG